MREAAQEIAMALIALIILGLTIYGSVCLYQRVIQVQFADRFGQWCEMTQERQSAVIGLHEHGLSSDRIQR